jgi:hypothetical protein
MSLPRGVAKSDSGFLFMLRRADELARWSDLELKERWRQVTSHMSPSGLDYVSGYVQNIAVAERNALTREMSRRTLTR